MSSNTLSYADMPAEKLSRATSPGGVLQQQLGVSFGVSAAALMLELVKSSGDALALHDFQKVFPPIAVVPLLAAAGFRLLAAEVGTAVSGHRRGQ